MTDQQIMSIAHDDLVRLFLLRRDDLSSAGKEAVRMVGMAQVIKRKLELNLELWAEDKDYIIDNIK